MIILRGTAKSNLNLKAAFWHIIGDAISSLGVITAAIIIFTTGFERADAIIAVLIAGIILWGASGLIKESIDILLEAVPKNIKRDDVVKAIEEVKGVLTVHDLHIWTITSGVNSMSAHVVIEDQTISNCQGIIQKINDVLIKKFNIMHTTLQMECGTCVSDSVCSVSPADLNDNHN
jgi:cobalt-zinc-cadmium efflux system protein